MATLRNLKFLKVAITNRSGRRRCGPGRRRSRGGRHAAEVRASSLLLIAARAFQPEARGGTAAFRSGRGGVGNDHSQPTPWGRSFSMSALDLSALLLTATTAEPR